MAKGIPQANIEKIQATGRRKTAVARVFLCPGEGKITVNDRKLEDYFLRETDRLIIMQPFAATKTTGTFDVMANVNGGGVNGQAEATRHAISRALIKADTAYRATLKSGGFLTRDARRKERKKYGQKRARKRFQYSKR
jgi:small subunit ribosomal protein S9